MNEICLNKRRHSFSNGQFVEKRVKLVQIVAFLPKTSFFIGIAIFASKL